jgi:hypothetical protein
LGIFASEEEQSQEERQISFLHALWLEVPNLESLDFIAKACGMTWAAAAIYRWIEDYERPESLSVFFRKERSDRGAQIGKSPLERAISALCKTAKLGVK